MRTCTIIGPGRAGQAFDIALRHIGWTTSVLGRQDSLTNATNGDLVLLTVPDDTIEVVAAALPSGPAVVAHVSGSRQLDVLAPHSPIGSIHPLMSLPDGARGAERLLDNCIFAISGDSKVSESMMTDLVAALDGTTVVVGDDQRALYHATACIAANHLVALCEQIETLAGHIGVPVAAYWQLMATTLENVTDKGPAEALTGPAARGDWDTVAHHIAALPSDERPLYLALSRRAASLAGHELPERFTAGVPTDSEGSKP